MGGGHFPDAEQFPQQVWELVGYLDSTLPDDHPFKKVRVQPEGKIAPELWLLGSSDYSGLLAAQLGVRFSFAHFINAQGGDLVMRAYKDRYQSSGHEPRPHTSLCCFVNCAASDDEAEKRAFSNEELQYIRSQRPRAVIGSPETCTEKLLDLAGKFSAAELMVLTITGDYASRLASYELLAKAFELATAG